MHLSSCLVWTPWQPLSYAWHICIASMCSLPSYTNEVMAHFTSKWVDKCCLLLKTREKEKKRKKGKLRLLHLSSYDNYIVSHAKNLRCLSTLSFKCLLNTILSEKNMAKYFLLQLSSSLKFILKVGWCRLILCMQKIVESQRLVYFWLDSTAILNFLFSQHIQWKSRRALLELNKDKEKKLDKKSSVVKMFCYVHIQ